MSKLNRLENELEELEALLEDRRKAFPAHSVSYQQLQRIEDMEEAIRSKKREIEAARKGSS